MDGTQPQTAKPISDDQELAKVLAGVSQESNNLDLEETPAAQSVAAPAATPAPAVPQTPIATYDTATSAAEVTPATAPKSGELNDIKKDVLTELRPLVDKLDLAPEEKFDTYLLLIRSTDDKALIAPAHEAAKNIVDETKRAQALLDIVKEIDYLSAPEQPTI